MYNILGRHQIMRHIEEDNEEKPQQGNQFNYTAKKSSHELN